MRFTLDKTASLEGLAKTINNTGETPFARQAAAYDLLTQHPDKLPALLHGNATAAPDTLGIVMNALQECNTLAQAGKLPQKQFEAASAGFAAMMTSMTSGNSR